MPVYNETIVAPVGLGDISTVLHNTSLDLGTLCLSPNIDKWARYKPVNLPNLGYVTEAQRRSINYGLSVAQYADPEDAAAAGWYYLKPTTKYRAFDFVKVSDGGVPSTTIGYKNIGVAPCRGFYSGSDGNQLTTYQYYTIQANQNAINFYVITTGSDYGIGLSELGDLSNWYLCLVVKVVKFGVTTVYMVTSAQPVGAGVSDPSVTDWQVIPVPSDDTIFSQDTTYRAWLVIANKSKTSWYNVASDSSLRFMPLPLTDPSIAKINFKVNVATYSAWVSGAWRKTSGVVTEQRKVWYYLYGKNSTSQPIPASALTIYVELVTAQSPEDVESATALATKTYSTSSTPTSRIPATGQGSVLLDGDGTDVYVGYNSLPSLTSGTIYLRVRGVDGNGTQVFSSFTGVTDEGVPPEPEPR